MKTFILTILIVPLLFITPLFIQAQGYDGLVKVFKMIEKEDINSMIYVLNDIESNYKEEYTPALIEVLGLTDNPTLVFEINKVLQDRSGKKINGYYEWIQWLWKKNPKYIDEQWNLKAELYKLIDPKFESYFKDRSSQSSIRLDEIVWGGVVQDGIPPLRDPVMIMAKDGGYLDDSDVVFGVVINGDAHAYPKRILAWHEFFISNIGGERVAGVYCTLCGTVIAYNARHNGTEFNLGTSGFLYRSNKLMYDEKTQSLWNTIEGSPVVGPLTGKNIKLSTFPVMTTSWAEWKSSYPDTKVLSINTGHKRDYGEGVAYNNYFNNDRLMFPVPLSNPLLKNKDEVIISRVEGYDNDPVAVSIDYLLKHSILNESVLDNNLVYIRDSHNIIRVYNRESYRFMWNSKGELTDQDDNIWSLNDDFLSYGNIELKRIPSHRIFWFAWYNSYPTTRLIKL